MRNFVQIGGKEEAGIGGSQAAGVGEQGNIGQRAEKSSGELKINIFSLFSKEHLISPFFFFQLFHQFCRRKVPWKDELGLQIKSL
jgi:hypothetical protein